MNKNIAKTLLSYRNALYVDSYMDRASLPTREESLFIHAIVMDINAYGFSFNADIINAMKGMSHKNLKRFHMDVVELIQEVMGDDCTYLPLFSGFPYKMPTYLHHQSFASRHGPSYTLLIDTLIYAPKDVNNIYATFNIAIACDDAIDNPALISNIPLRRIGRATNETVLEVFDNLLTSKASVSEADKNYIYAVVDKSYLKSFKGIYRKGVDGTVNYNVLLPCTQMGEKYVLPDNIPNKENLAHLIGAVNKAHGSLGFHTIKALSPHVKTATDVLRIAASFSGSDVTLKDHTRFKISNNPRKFLLSTLDGLDYHSATEDMLRYHGLWLVLAKYLHVNAYAEDYPNAVKMVQAIRNAPKSIPTFNKAVEKALSDENPDIYGLIEMLETRPGDFARRVDHLLRMCRDSASEKAVVDAFLNVADKVAAPLLLNLAAHMYHRHAPANVRVFLPKGSTTNAIVEKDDSRRTLDAEICFRLASGISKTLSKRYAERVSLGKVYIDKALSDILVPTSVRNASASLNTFARGSKFDIDETADVIRMFLYWEDIQDSSYYSRVDIDLSVQIMDKNFNNLGVVSYYNLTEYGITHSGDFTSAPNGASEFIDVDISKIRTNRPNIRYIAMTVNSYTGQPFDAMVAKAGYMVRDGKTGRTFEAKTVKQKYDVTASTKFAIPMVFDLVERKMIWLDMGFTDYNHSCTNIGDKGADLGILTQYATEMYKEKANLLDLIMLHTDGRADSVTFDFDPDVKYDTVFDMEFATKVDEIMSNWV